jgi:hypothetical protein
MSNFYIFDIELWSWTMSTFRASNSLSDVIATDWKDIQRAGPHSDRTGTNWRLPASEFRHEEKGEIASPRVLIRPRPGFYLMRLRSTTPLVPAVIYQLCPMVIPQPTTATGPHPDEWCRPLERPRRFEARINGMRVDIDSVWTARSLRVISIGDYASRMRVIRRSARLGDNGPWCRPERRVDLNRLPPIF